MGKKNLPAVIWAVAGLAGGRNLCLESGHAEDGGTPCLGKHAE